MRLEGKVILVTASTRGIGRSIVEACAREGAKVYMGARNLERAKNVAEELNAAGGCVSYVYNNAMEEDSYITMIDEVVEREGRIDVLVNNFGTSNPKKDLDFAHTDVDTFIETLNINLKSVFIASQHAVKKMEKTGGGSIINISSVGGLVPDISQVAYGTSKAAINYLTKIIAVHEARHKIRCNAVLPGMTATDAVQQNLSDDFRDLFLKHTPINRMGLPEEIAAAVVYLASDDAAYTTGQILTVAGGFGLATPVFGDLADKSSRR